jgi:pimeloyl-ACP methyl ester carboxylesterase
MDTMNWLFLRGLTREKRHWGEFVSVFPEVLKGDKVLCLDLPGFGTENEMTVPLSIAQMVNELRDRWQLQKGREMYQSTSKWGILGISLGGMIVMDWIAKFPGDFALATIINSSAADLSPPYHRLRPARIADILKTRFIKNSTEREEVVLKMTTRMVTNINDRAREWGQFLKERPYKPKNAIRQLAAATMFKSPEKIEIPTLFLASENDAFTNSACSKRLAQKFSSQIAIHEQAGHDLTLDDPEWVSHQVLKFKSQPNVRN